MKVVIVTGGFDPLHSGHIQYFKSAKELGDQLVVGLNSDGWLSRKKGKPFMPFAERKVIIEHLSMVDKVISFDDSDNTACGAIYKVMATIGNGEQIIFANGGDRGQNQTPEHKTYDGIIDFVYNVGGSDKKNSSSWLLDKWKTEKTHRSWGWWSVIESYGKTCKIKELVVNPKSSLSWQRHEFRSEVWFVRKGTATIYYSDDREGEINVFKVKKIEKQTHRISRYQWHCLANETNEELSVIEIQFGPDCRESDIIRKERPRGDYLFSD